jgi:hypothetical protein
MTDRRFPPPWTIEDLTACFVVKDGGDQKLAHGQAGRVQSFIACSVGMNS